jgi:DNA polymerase-3 subunit gamma/tau
LQHFSRELARYFRNLLVAKVAGPDTRLIAASPAQRERLSQIATRFSEEDLTRYLQLTLDLFKDLQSSLQPRFHLEIGLVRLVQAGRLVKIEEALEALGEAPPHSPPPAPPAPPVSSGPSPFERDRARKAGPQAADLPVRERVHAALLEMGHNYTADAVEHSTVTLADNEMRFVSPSEFKLSMETGVLEQAARQAAGRPVRVNVTFTEGDPGAQPPIARPPQQDDLETRALAHPEVQRFRELFPNAEVRQVRNLKE